MKETLADRLERLLREQGRDAREVSLAVGTNHSLVWDILKRDKARNPRADTVAKLAKELGTSVEYLLHGEGDPSPVQPGRPRPNAREATARGVVRSDLRLDVPVMGTAAGSLAGAFVLGDSVVDYVRRPPALAGSQSVYAIYVTGDSMSPAHEEGDLRYVHPGRPVQIGDTVLIVVQYEENDEEQCFIKRLIKRTADKIVTEQFNPRLQIEFDKAHVKALHKVLTINDLFGI